jgi:phosphopantetheinyl transferase (holo-ACP synthase)
VPKRRADWLAGRRAAKAVVARALRELAPGEWPLAAIEIASAPGGAPFARVAPEAAPVAGFAPGERLPAAVSISHAEGRALCAAAVGPGRALGVDLGLVEPRSPAFVETFLAADEQAFVREGPPSQRDLRANLVWGAKEATLKALGLGLTVDTVALSCLPEPGLADAAAWPLSPAVGGWRPFVARCGPAVVPGGAIVRGIWRGFGPFVAALATV